MGPRAKSVSFVVALALGVAGATEGCRSPTQVTLDITYGGRCEELSGVAFIVGTDPYASESRIESNIFTTTTMDCTPGAGSAPAHVGTLVVTPNDGTDRASIVVLAGFGKRVEDCKPRDGYFGCIVARRSFLFVEHSALTLDIPLDVDCKNVPCNAVSTCRKGSCVDSDVACSADGCEAPGDLPDGGLATVDAPTDPDAFVQGDAPLPPPDAKVDAPTDAPLETGTEAGTCEPADAPLVCTTASGGKTCAPGQLCCAGYDAAVDAGADGGDGGSNYRYDCRAGCSPDFQNGNVSCTSVRQCPVGTVCCLGSMPPSGTFCATSCTNMFDAGAGTQLCEESCECKQGSCAARGVKVGTRPAQSLKSCGP